MSELNVPPAPAIEAAQIGPHCLVTGGAGYLGRVLVRRLRELGVKVRSFDIARHDHGPDVDVRVGDLQDAAAVRAACTGVDTVFHTAALITLLTMYKTEQRRRTFSVNVNGTENLLRASAAAGVKALVYTSSFNVALSECATVQDETLPYADHARDLYSLSKIAAERITLAADNGSGVRTCALRPGGIWGCDVDSLMVRSFLTQLAAGKFTALIGRRSATFDNTHVENLADAQLLAARALRTATAVAGGHAYNITDSETVNGMEWFRPLTEGLGYRFPKVWLPEWLQRTIATSMEAAHFAGAPAPLLTLRGVENLCLGSNLSIDKARRDLGYVPRFNRANGFPQLLPIAREQIRAWKGKAA